MELAKVHVSVRRQVLVGVVSYGYTQGLDQAPSAD